MNLLDQLILVANTYCAACGLSRSRVSTLVFSRGTKLDEIIFYQADVTTGVYERAMQYFSDHWPEGAVWPESIERPTPRCKDTAQAHDEFFEGQRT